jgi:hypothetical protein
MNPLSTTQQKLTHRVRLGKGHLNPAHCRRTGDVRRDQRVSREGRVEKGVVVGERRKDVVFICESRRGS